MNEKYLWDKTGEDTEIERLENALKVFRYKESAPPALPAKNVTAKETAAPRRFFDFNFRLAIPSFAAIALIFFVFWFQLSDSRNFSGAETAKTTSPENIEQIVSESSLKERGVSTVEISQTPLNNHEPKFIKARHTVSDGKAVNKNFARKIRLKNSEPRLNTEPALTEEEKYAYDQLMLALSITSSKLKIVKDKIDGIEEPNDALETAR
jgi:hypothetical protein